MRVKVQVRNLGWRGEIGGSRRRCEEVESRHFSLQRGGNTKMHVVTSPCELHRERLHQRHFTHARKDHFENTLGLGYAKVTKRDVF